MTKVGVFEVHVRVESVRLSRNTYYVTGLDDNGDTVIYTPSREQGKDISDRINEDPDNALEDVVPGHIIYAYSGARGPWGPAPIRRVDVRDLAKKAD